MLQLFDSGGDAGPAAAAAAAAVATAAASCFLYLWLLLFLIWRHWSHSFGLVPHRSKELRKLRYGDIDII